jgi:hypothetical protein
MTDDEIADLRKRVAALEQHAKKQDEMLKQILDEIQSMEERGLARFDATTFESPSEIHTAWRILNEQAGKSPDGYVAREDVKVKTASQEDIMKTKARQQVDKLIDAGFVEHHEHKEGFISPKDGVDDEDIAGLFTSNFDQADARREKAESRGESRDPPRGY